MADDQQAKNAETETQSEPMPSSDNKTTPESTDVGQATEGTETTQEGGLPDSAKDRTKREFDKLQEQLISERTKREYAEGVYNSLYKQQQASKKADTKPIVDPDTGLIDEKSLTNLDKRSVDAEKRVAELEQSVRGYISNVEDREAYEAHPGLNPHVKDTFDRKLHIETRKILTDSMVNPQDYGGKQLSFKEAGDMAKGTGTEAVKEAKEKGAKEAVDNLTQKEQASLAAEGSEINRRNVTDDIDSLRSATRLGDDEALAERLNKLKAGQNKRTIITFI